MNEEMLTEEEFKIIISAQKKIMEVIAEAIPGSLQEERHFKNTTFLLSLIISNFLNSCGIENAEPYMEYFSSSVMQMYPNTIKYSSYMIYEGNKKIKEGKFQNDTEH